MKHFHSFTLLLLPLLILCSCSEQRFMEQRLAISKNLSIPVAMIVYARSAPDWDAIFNTLNGYAHRYDYRIESNTVWLLNRNSTARLDADVYSILKLAVHIAELSDGAFDPTILPLVQLWNIEDEQIQSGSWRPPAGPAIQAARLKVDYRSIGFKDDNTVTIPAGAGIDLGGIAKGAIVDKIADYLETLGYHAFLVEAGGDILISGLKPALAAGKSGQTRQWTVAIRHPRRSEEFLATVTIGTEKQRIAMVTSGDYERFVVVDGRRYHHLLDPATGYPAEETTSVTVLAGTCAEADALATAAFVRGYEAGTALLEQQAGVEGLVVREHNNRLEAALTSGFPAKAAELNLNR